jgi:hypothetical protein
LIFLLFSAAHPPTLLAFDVSLICLTATPLSFGAEGRKTSAAESARGREDEAAEEKAEREEEEEEEEEERMWV